MITTGQLITAIIAVAAAVVISLALTPLVKRLAERFGFVDIPKDERRMHNKAIPTIGGLAIYAAFLLVALVLVPMNRELISALIGSLIIVVMGLIDDKYNLDAKLKFLIQIIAAAIPVSQGCIIEYISNPVSASDGYIGLGVLSIPISILWIVAMTNAVNFIDGLDGLSVGVCSISCLTMGVIALIMGQGTDAILLGCLLGACLGFLPYNFNPAKIFMGDTGATFLGYMLACLSVSGLFKLYAAVSFVVPLLVLGVPLFDITFAFIRRIWHRVSPMHADRSHIHHRLIDSGLNQRQSVMILYLAASVMGILAVFLSTQGASKAVIILVAVVVLGCAALWLLSRNYHKKQDSLENEKNKENED